MAGRPLRRARLLANPPHVEDAGGSPLVYFGWKHHDKQRLVVIDEDEPDAAPGTEMYKRKEVWRTWSQRTGKRLKKPVLDEVIEGAPPHTMACLCALLQPPCAAELQHPSRGLSHLLLHVPQVQQPDWTALG